TPGEVQATAFDEASFQCQTPGLTVMKDCALRDIDGNSAVTITVQNTGTADLENCTVTAPKFTDAAWPASGGPTGTGSAAAWRTVQYVAKNTGGTGLFSCTVTDSNTAISSTAVNIGDVASGGTSAPVPVNTTCSDTLDASEPDTATLSCFCTADLNPNFKATAQDSASFDR